MLESIETKKNELLKKSREFIHKFEIGILINFFINDSESLYINLKLKNIKNINFLMQ